MSEEQDELTPSEAPADKIAEAEDKAVQEENRKIRTLEVFRYGNAGMEDVDNMEETEALKIREVLYDESGHVLKETELNEEGEAAEEFIRTYDSNGNIIELQHFYEGVLSEKTLYGYNDQGLLSKEQLKYADGGTILTEYQYDEHKNVIEKKVSDDEGEVESVERCTYDGKRLLEMKRTDGEGNLVESRKLTYRTDNPELVQEEVSYEASNNMELRTVYLDNEAGTITYNKEGKVHSRQKAVYDEKKRLAETLISTFSGNYLYKYAYDEQDNVIEEERQLGGTVFFKALVAYHTNGSLKARSVTEMNSGLFTDIYKYAYFE